MDFILWLLHGACLLIGALVLIVLSAVLLAGTYSLIVLNWVTHSDAKTGEVLISRITGLLRTHWYWRDPNRSLEEFGCYSYGEDELIFTRYLLAVTQKVPIWEIRYGDFKNKRILKISYMSEQGIVVATKASGQEWILHIMNKANFENSQYFPLVKRAADLQIDIRKRFKKMLSRPTA